MNLDEVESMIAFYEKLAHRNANDAHNLYLECNALTLQLRTMLNQIMRERTERKKRWWRIWL